MYKQNLRKIFILFSVLSISLYALYLRLINLVQHEFWADEYYQLNQMSGTFVDLLKSLPRNEFCSYLSGDYYLVYPFFKIFSFNKWGLAIPHIMFTILGFYILYLICKQYFKTVWGYLITFVVVCFNATLIHHATEIRTYAVLPTLALAAFYLAQLLLDSNFQVSVIRKIWIGIFFVMLILFHAYGIIIFFCTLIFALFDRKDGKSIKPLLGNLFKFMLIVLGVAMPLWLYSVFGPHLSTHLFKLNPSEYIPSFFTKPIGFLKCVFGNLIGFKTLYFLLPGVLFPFVLPLRDRFRLIFFLIIIVIIPITLLYISNVIGEYWFIQRQFIWVMPLFAFFLGWCWDATFIYAQAKVKNFKRLK